MALGIAASLVASSHGSTSIRAKADSTLSRIPSASSQIGANRKSLYLEDGIEAEGRLFTVEPPLVTSMNASPTSDGTVCFKMPRGKSNNCQLNRFRPRSKSRSLHIARRTSSSRDVERAESSGSGRGRSLDRVIAAKSARNVAFEASRLKATVRDQ